MFHAANIYSMFTPLSSDFMNTVPAQCCVLLEPPSLWRANFGGRTLRRITGSSISSHSSVMFIFCYECTVDVHLLIDRQKVCLLQALWSDLQRFALKVPPVSKYQVSVGLSAEIFLLHYVETCLQKKWMNNGQSPVIHSFMFYLILSTRYFMTSFCTYVEPQSKSLDFPCQRMTRSKKM